MADHMDRIGLDAVANVSRGGRAARRKTPARNDTDLYTVTGGPAKTPPAALCPHSPKLNSEHVRQLLQQGFSRGLAKALASNAAAFHQRIWIVDNSGSMQIGDGHRIMENGNKVLVQPVTRWDEIQDTVLYHSQMAAVLDSPTVFRLLNHPGGNVPQEFSIARGLHTDVEEDIRNAKIVMQRARPIGVTPLTDHIWQIQATVAQMEPALRRKGQRIAIVLATDGLPTDAEGYGGDEVTEDFIKALQSLEGLPVWVVIRLCTDEDSVTQFYNKLDGMLELSLEVLDDFLAEAREVHKVNKWLNYALPMHRCRELGYHDRLFDLIDERTLTKWELREFCALLFDSDAKVIPDPVSSWKEFMHYLQDRLAAEQEQWDPNRKKRGPWINLKALHKIYGKGKCTIM